MRNVKEKNELPIFRSKINKMNSSNTFSALTTSRTYTGKYNTINYDKLGRDMLTIKNRILLNSNKKLCESNTQIWEILRKKEESSNYDKGLKVSFSTLQVDALDQTKKNAYIRINIDKKNKENAKLSTNIDLGKIKIGNLNKESINLKNKINEVDKKKKEIEYVNVELRKRIDSVEMNFFEKGSKLDIDLERLEIENKEFLTKNEELKEKQSSLIKTKKDYEDMIKKMKFTITNLQKKLINDNNYQNLGKLKIIDNELLDKSKNIDEIKKLHLELKQANITINNEINKINYEIASFQKRKSEIREYQNKVNKIKEKIELFEKSIQTKSYFINSLETKKNTLLIQMNKKNSISNNDLQRLERENKLLEQKEKELQNIVNKILDRNVSLKHMYENKELLINQLKESSYTKNNQTLNKNNDNTNEFQKVNEVNQNKNDLICQNQEKKRNINLISQIPELSQNQIMHNNTFTQGKVDEENQNNLNNNNNYKQTLTLSQVIKNEQKKKDEPIINQIINIDENESKGQNTINIRKEENSQTEDNLKNVDQIIKENKNNEVHQSLINKEEENKIIKEISVYPSESSRNNQIEQNQKNEIQKEEKNMEVESIENKNINNQIMENSIPELKDKEVIITNNENAEMNQNFPQDLPTLNTKLKGKKPVQNIKEESKQPIIQELPQAFNIFAVSKENQSLISFNTLDKSYTTISNIQDFPPIQENTTVITLNTLQGVFILTGQNTNILYYYSQIQNVIAQITVLKENHLDGFLLLNDYDKSIIILSGQFTKVVEAYSFVTNTLVELPSMNYNRTNGSYCLIDKKIYAFFGYDSNQEQFIKNIEYLDLNLNCPRWMELILNCDFGLTRCLSIYSGQNTILFFGGTNDQEDYNRENFELDLNNFSIKKSNKYSFEYNDKKERFLFGNNCGINPLVDRINKTIELITMDDDNDVIIFDNKDKFIWYPYNKQ